MNKHISKIIVLVVAIVVILFVVRSEAPTSAQYSTPATGAAEVENSLLTNDDDKGQLFFSDCTNCSVTVSDNAVTGFAFGEVISWVNFNPPNGGVLNDGLGNLSGLAFGHVAGSINFDPAGNPRVQIVPDTNGNGLYEFDGLAYSQNYGWIKFDCSEIPGTAIGDGDGRSACVETSWNPDVDGDGIFNINDSCPLQPENFNDYEDTDGCPDTVPAVPGGTVPIGVIACRSIRCNPQNQTLTLLPDGFVQASFSTNASVSCLPLSWSAPGGDPPSSSIPEHTGFSTIYDTPGEKTVTVTTINGLKDNCSVTVECPSDKPIWNEETEECVKKKVIEVGPLCTAEADTESEIVGGCNDGRDNDCDVDIDCEDSDCAADPVCAIPVCEDPDAENVGGSLPCEYRNTSCGINVEEEVDCILGTLTTDKSQWVQGCRDSFDCPIEGEVRGVDLCPETEEFDYEYPYPGNEEDPCRPPGPEIICVGEECPEETYGVCQDADGIITCVQVPCPPEEPCPAPQCGPGAPFFFCSPEGEAEQVEEDTDGDGTPDDQDPFPYDPNEWQDTDGDGQGDNADPDDDGDGIPDEDDPTPKGELEAPVLGEPTQPGPKPGLGGALDELGKVIANASQDAADFVKDFAGNVGEGIKTVFGAFGDAFDEIAKILENPGINTGQKIAGIVGALAGAFSLLGLALGASGNPLSGPDTLTSLWSLLLGVLGIKKKREWGTAYDAVNKSPLDPVYVSLHKANPGEEVASAITDIRGRYGFADIEPGTYILKAEKTNYKFPSEKLKGKEKDEIYNDLYFGEPFEIKSKDEVINKNIPMDPVGFDWNEYAKKQKQIVKGHSRRELFLIRIANILFVIGFTVTLIALLVNPVLLNIILFAIYLLLLFVRRRGFKALKNMGQVFTSDGKTPLPYALLKIWNAKLGVMIKKVVANHLGRYYALVPAGQEYYVTIDQKLPDESYKQIFKSEPFEPKRGIIKKEFTVHAEPALAIAPPPPSPHLRRGKEEAVEAPPVPPEAPTPSPAAAMKEEAVFPKREEKVPPEKKAKMPPIPAKAEAPLVATKEELKELKQRIDSLEEQERLLLKQLEEHNQIDAELKEQLKSHDAAEASFKAALEAHQEREYLLEQDIRNLREEIGFYKEKLAREEVSSSLAAEEIEQKKVSPPEETPELDELLRKSDEKAENHS